MCFRHPGKLSPTFDESCRRDTFIRAWHLQVGLRCVFKKIIEPGDEEVDNSLPVLGPQQDEQVDGPRPVGRPGRPKKEVVCHSADDIEEAFAVAIREMPRHNQGMARLVWKKKVANNPAHPCHILTANDMTDVENYFKERSSGVKDLHDWPLRQVMHHTFVMRSCP